MPLVVLALESGERNTPDYINVDATNFVATYTRVPAFADVPYPVQMFPELVVEFYRIADEDLADLGRPLMATRTINTLSGYIKCAESHFEGNCYEEERTRINAYLVGGFFYE